MPRYTFGPFLLDTEARSLLRSGEPVAMVGKTFDTLSVLVQNHGRLMDKDELLSQIWTGLVVEEANLSQSIFTVRKILGDSPKDRRYIATVAGRGYQFVAPVTELSPEQLPEPTPERAATAPAPLLHKKVALGLIVLAVVGGAVLWLILHRPARTTALAERRLTFNSSASPITSAAISPDGKYLAYSDPSGIHIRLLSTGEQHVVPTPELIPSGAMPHIDGWFPNGTELLVHSYNALGPGSLWAVSVAGQSSRELRRGVWGWSVSPDGARIAFSPGSVGDAPRELWIMDNQGSNAYKVLSGAPGEGMWSVRWSPDGQRLAYVRALESQQLIETCDLKGANRTTVVIAEPRNLVWLPDKRIVYSAGEARNVDANLWTIGVDNRGAPIGKPMRLTRWTGADLQDFSASADGKQLVLRKDTFPGQVYIGELTAGGTRLSTPRLLSHDEAYSAGTGWTADSQAVLLMSNRHGKWGIFRQPIGTDTAAPLVEGRDDIGFPHLSADGEWVVYVENLKAVGLSRPYRLMRVPVNGGPPQLVLEGTNLQHHQCVNRRNLCVVIEWKQDEKQFTVTAFDPLSGRGKLLRTIEHVDGGANHALAPDGSTFALAVAGQPDAHIRFLSLTGGVDREVAIKGWPNTTSMEWAADGKALYCGTSSSQSASLLRVDVKGTAQVLWQSQEVGGDSFLAASPSPDGRHLAISGGTRNSNAWIIEGY